MPAYLIAEHKITDPIKFDGYRTKVGPMIARYGGRYLTKGGSHKMPERLYLQRSSHSEVFSSLKSSAAQYPVKNLRSVQYVSADTRIIRLTPASSGLEYLNNYNVKGL